MEVDRLFLLEKGKIGPFLILKWDFWGTYKRKGLKAETIDKMDK